MINKDLLNTHRTLLLRYALLQLHDNNAAEDVVQETLLAALQAIDSFRYESAIRTWLIAILKHKMVDYCRANEKYYSLADYNNSDGQTMDETLEQLLFNTNGRWLETPSEWHNPDYALEQKQFWQLFDWCQKNLPAQNARAFMLREMVGLNTEEICHDMVISHSACRVYLHRARLGLRECLTQRWFIS